MKAKSTKPINQPPKRLRVIVQVRPGNNRSYGATIYESAETPEQLTNRLRIMLKAPTPAGRTRLLRAIGITVRKAQNSKEECTFVNLSSLFKSPILSDGFGIDYELWIPGRGWDGCAIRAGRDNPQQFLFQGE